MKHATAFKRKDGWHLRSDSRSNGAWIGGPPFIKLPLDASCETLGQGILTAFSGSKPDVPFPTDWDSGFEPALALAGVKSWTAFAQNSRCIGVRVTTTAIIFLPSRKDRGNFLPLPDLEFQLSLDASPEQIGQALQRGIALCK